MTNGPVEKRTLILKLWTNVKTLWKYVWNFIVLQSLCLFIHKPMDHGTLRFENQPSGNVIQSESFRVL